MSSLRWIFIALFFAGCSKHFTATQYAYQERKLVQNSPPESQMSAEIAPYRDSLAKEMNVALASSDTVLTRSQPESDLGNLMCELILKKAKDYYHGNIDFTFMNYGGIRIPNLPAGKITLGNMIELMPFENRVAVMSLNGKAVDSLFNHMAYNKGWPVAGARYKIKDKTATDILINGQALDLNKTYVVAVSDYLAQGGDNCNMLKGKPYTDLKKTVRDALIEGLKDMTAKGERVKSVIDGRVSIAP